MPPPAPRSSLTWRLTNLYRHGPEAVTGNKAFARFLTIRKGSVTINEPAVEADDSGSTGSSSSGRTPVLPAAEVALAYKSLWPVERTFREEKSMLEVRPVYQQRDETNRSTSSPAS